MIFSSGAMFRRSEEKLRWRLSQKRRLTLFFILCGLIFFKVVWMSMSDTKHDISRQHERAIWLSSQSDDSVNSAYKYHRNHIERLPLNFSIATPQYLEEIKRTRVINPAIDCPALFEGDPGNVSATHDYMYQNPRPSLTAFDYLTMADDCAVFRSSRGYIMHPTSEEERNFPLAFSFLMYTDVEQVERLLRAVYAPQNFYCVHVDIKAADEVHMAMRAIARCFPNVFVASRLESVFWGHISILYAEMNCISDLLQYQWRYFINLSGQMFPLHTNSELVKILKLYNGANDIEGTYKRSRSFWLSVRQTFSWRLYESLNTMLITIYPKSSPPHNVTIYKGSNQGAISRAFAVYLLKAPEARDLMTWFSDTLAPDEYLWPTLNHNPHLMAPGSYTGDPETKTFTARATIWLPVANQVNWSWKPWKCQGKWVREICVFGVGDMPWLYERPELFANKFHQDFEYVAYDCMEQLMFNRTIEQSALNFDPTYYLNMSIVKHPDLIVPAEDVYTKV